MHAKRATRADAPSVSRLPSRWSMRSVGIGAACAPVPDEKTRSTKRATNGSDEYGTTRAALLKIEAQAGR